jgi:hypothetical protein
VSPHLPYKVTFEKPRLAPWETTRVTITRHTGFAPPTGGGQITVRGIGAVGTAFNLEIGVRVVPGFDFANGEQRVPFVPVRAKGVNPTAQSRAYSLSSIERSSITEKYPLPITQCVAIVEPPCNLFWKR